MNFQILSIKARGNVVLSKNGRPVNPENPIWQQEISFENETHSSHPAAFPINEKNQSTPVALEVTVNIPNAKTNIEYILVGRYEGIVVFFSGSAKHLGPDDTLVLDVVPQFRPDGFFCILGENISWQLTRKDNGKTCESQAVYLELYWLYSDNSRHFERGIPVEALRAMNQGCGIYKQLQPTRFDKMEDVIKMESIKSEMPTEGWEIERVVNWCFHRNPPHYDTCGGQSTFGIYIDYNRITFRLNMYLKAIDIRDCTCNCFDQAAALDYFLWVAGYRNVLFYRMEPFGYLRKTNLVGIGECNNPKYESKEGQKAVVDEMDPHRTYFKRHTFCYLPDKEWVLDSCVGPHTGGENIEVYTNEVVDDIHQPLPRELQKKPEFKPYLGVSYISKLISFKKKPKLLIIKSLMEIVRFSDKDFKKIPKESVIHSWPSPYDYPGIKKNEWITVLDEIIPGPDEVLRTWIIKKEAQSIHLDLFVSSGGNEFSINRFLSFGALNPLPELPYKIGPDYLGHYSAKFITDKYSRYFWVFHNVVFDIRFRNITFDVEEFVKWLNGQAIKHTGKNLEKYLPVCNYKSCSNHKPTVGSNVMLEMKPEKENLNDFIIRKGDGLKLIEETDKSLLFKTLKKSRNKMVLLTVDKNTLLVRRSKPITINVKKQ